MTDLATKHLHAAILKHLDRAAEAVRHARKFAALTKEDWAAVRDKLWEVKRETFEEDKP